MKKNNKRKNQLIKIAGMVGLFLLVFAISYALFTVTLNGTKQNRITMGTVSLKLTEMDGTIISTTGDDYKTSTSYMINIEDGIPLTNEEGLATDGYQFKLVNDGGIDVRYQMYLKVPSTVTLDAQYVRFDLEQDGEKVTYKPEKLNTMTTTNIVDSQQDSFTLYKIDGDLINRNANTTYKLRLWVDHDAGNAAMDKEFVAWLYVDGTQRTGRTNPFKDDTIAYVIWRDNPNPEHLTSVSASGFNTDYGETAGLYSTTDMNGGETYFYRGPVTNNYYVKEGDSTGNAYDRLYRVKEDGSVTAFLLGLSTSVQYATSPSSFVHYKNSNLKQGMDEISNTYAESLGAQSTTWCADSVTRTNNDLRTIKFPEAGSNVNISFMGPYSKFNTNGVDLSDVENMTEAEISQAIQKLKIDIDLSCTSGDKYEAAFSPLPAWDAVLAGYGIDGGGSTFFGQGQSWSAWLNSSAATLSDGNDFEQYAYAFDRDGLELKNVTETAGFHIMYAFPNNIRVIGGNGTINNPYILKDYNN